MNAIIAYPKYYRKAGRCVKVVSPVETRTIILPPEASAAERFSSNYPDVDRLLQALKEYQETDLQTWTDFLSTFYTSISDERSEQQKRVKAELKDLATPKPPIPPPDRPVYPAKAKTVSEQNEVWQNMKHEQE